MTLMKCKSSRRMTFSLACLIALASFVAPSAQAQERIRIALLPMVVHSAETPGYLRRGLADMLSSRLERIRDFEVVRVEGGKAATTHFAKALQHAAKVDADFVLFGSFTRFGTGASLDIQCAEVTGEEHPREIFVHSGNLGDVIPDLDDLVGKIARFVIADYSQRVADASGQAPDLPSTRAIKSLEARVEALEAALQTLSTEPSPSPDASPEEEVGAGPEPAAPEQ